ncbi:MAG TPA: malonyl-[acyl-carrier protein] O-methyltransferase BioC [Oceanospirillales bacterium]|nr:malonyl-[acyl-carrier protein] O-methyltransferase BioC [Oceanospirillales bacterium]|tara:strand:+ start:202 stop:1020 length:819 start_codon:yes stop_codon:yes gene_type:complete
MTNSTLPRNKQQVASQFNRAAHTYDNAARIQQLSADELAQRLQTIQDTEQSSITGNWLDLGCGTGFSVPTLIQQGAQYVIGADLAHTMCLTSKEKLAELPFHSVTCDAERLPFSNHSFDGIYSNLMIQWSEQLEDLFYEALRVLKSDGVFAFATLGPKTMLELKSAWQQVDPFTHVNTFDNKDSLVALCEQFFDIESIHQQAVTQQHSSLKSLLKELKAIGATNVNSGRRPGLGGRERIKKLEQAYRQQSESDYLPLTYDLIWIVARKRSDA